MDRSETLYGEVIGLIRERSVLKRDVFELGKERFAELKEELKGLRARLKTDVAAFDPRLEVSFSDQGPFVCQLTIAGDVLLFVMHTNVFRFEESSSYWKSGYLKDHEQRGYCAAIQVYNFLADSMRYNRLNDLGYLVARIFVNCENHFFVEGRKELGYLFNDFVQSTFTRACMQEVLLAIVRYTLKFDLYAPPYANVAQITVQDATAQKDALASQTGKRLGFQFYNGRESGE
jgi:hypothetical protein